MRAQSEGLGRRGSTSRLFLIGRTSARCAYSGSDRVRSKVSYDWYYLKRVIGNIYSDYDTSQMISSVRGLDWLEAVPSMIILCPEGF